MSDEKILIIRFSSFGDIIQAMSALIPLKQRYPEAKIHWLVRSDFAELVGLNPLVDKVISFDRREGLSGLIALAHKLGHEKYSHIYDAHSNIRSHIISFLMKKFPWQKNFIRRPKERWKRFLLFKMRINKFSWPYRGMLSYQRPLEKWGVRINREQKQEWTFSEELLDKVKALVPASFVAIIPSAAWEMKRWPLESWKQLIGLLKDENIVVFGGPEDHFCAELVKINPERVFNLAGKLSLIESCALLTLSKYMVSGDTGLLHVADLLGVQGAALIGPTAFGFPTGNHIVTVDVPLPCRPCTKDGRGKCIQNVYKKCLVDLTPNQVKGIIDSRRW